MSISSECYEVVKAKSWEEAKLKSKWKIGELVEVVAIKAIANSNGTFTMYPLCGKRESQ